MFHQLAQIPMNNGSALNSSINHDLQSVESLEKNHLQLRVINADTQLTNLADFGRSDQLTANAYDYLWSVRSEISRLRTTDPLDETTIRSYLDSLVQQLNSRSTAYEHSLGDTINQLLQGAITSDILNTVFASVVEHHLGLIFSGYVDLRIKERDEQGIALAQKGLNPDQSLSGMTLVFYEEGNTENPIATMNILLTQFERYDSETKFVRKVIEDEKQGIEIVSPRQSIGSPDYILTPGWLHIRPDHVGRSDLIFTILELYRKVFQSINNWMKVNNKECLILLERDGKAFEYTPQLIESLSKPAGTFIPSSDIKAVERNPDGSVDSEVNIFNQVPVSSEESAAVGALARRLGMKPIDVSHLVPNFFGEVYVGNLEDAI